MVRLELLYEAGMDCPDGLLYSHWAVFHVSWELPAADLKAKDINWPLPIWSAWPEVAQVK